MRERQLLTKSEFKVMGILWNLPQQCGVVNDILAMYNNPKPAYSTVATFLNILKHKGYVRTQKQGNKLKFIPIISKTEYAKRYLKPVKNIFFNGELPKMIQFILQEEAPTDKELHDIAENILPPFLS